MGDNTTIEWTEATWNPIRGCSRISPGCQHCYAERVAARFNGPGQAYEGLAVMKSNGAHWTGELRLVEEHLEDPLRWKRPRRIFVNSMSDLFHENMPGEWIDRVVEVMLKAKQHTFQVLTKRAERMYDYISRNCWLTNDPLPNVWWGVSVENQKAADERLRWLLRTPAAVRWLSVEPLLGPVDLCAAGMKINGKLDVHTGERIFIDWVVVGGESGPSARPMHPAWARQIRDDCRTCGVPFFFKQWGEWAPTDYRGVGTSWPYGHGRFANWIAERETWHESTIPGGSTVLARIGKKEAGRSLDGVEWNSYPS